MPARRRWLFRLVAAVVVLLPLVLLEFILRASGFGHPTSFFLPRKIGGKAAVVENTWFGLRFFPPSQARSPSPLVVHHPKPKGVYRIFLFGESAAMGDPRPAYGVGRCLESLLRTRFPEREFEVISVGTTAINSHGLLPIARECAQYEGDLWIFYMGHNEFVGPFGANTVFGPAAPPWWMVRGYLALQRTRTGQLLVGLVRRLHSGGRNHGAWGGMRAFLDQEVSPADPRKERVYASFRRNLEDMVRVATRRKVPLLLSTAASNLKDCAPFASVHAPPLPGPKQAEWDQHFQSGLTNQLQGASAQALNHYRAAAELSPLYAEGQFRFGQCLLETGQTNAAVEAYRRARDADALAFRANTVINQIIRDVSQRYAAHGVNFLDADAVLAPLSAGHIIGEESFLEHVHLNFEGNYQLARALAERAVTALPRNALGRLNPAWEDSATCARDLGLTAWNYSTIWEEIQQRISDAPFTNQADHALTLHKVETYLTECKARLREQAAPDAHLVYQQAIQKRPQDHWLHHNYAEFLAAIGDLPRATEQMRLVCELVPQHLSGHLQLGRLLARQGRFDEAAKAFETALSVRPGAGNVYVELGRVRSGQRRFVEALQAYDLARLSNVDPARICLLRAQVLEQQEKRAESIESLREAIRLRPDYWEARERLALALALQNQFGEAATEFDKVVRLHPGSGEAHFNLGIALARQDHFDEALAHLETALRLEPQNQKIRDFISAIQQRRRAQTAQ